MTKENPKKGSFTLPDKRARESTFDQHGSFLTNFAFFIFSPHIKGPMPNE